MSVFHTISMTRKILALAVVLTISGLAPAGAVLGFCAKMPCCFGELGGAPILGPDMAGCCTTISCYDAPSHELTVNAKAKSIAASTPAPVSVLVARPGIHFVRGTFDDTSPPPKMQQRLSSLSILLI